MRSFFSVYFVAFAAIFTVSLSARDIRADDVSDLYRVAKQLLGSKDQTILASGHRRLIVSKSADPEELVLLSITDLRANPENVLSSFPAYSLSEKRIYSTKLYHCSWRDINKKIIYECGESMKFPEGLQQSISDNVMSDFMKVLK